MVSVKCQGEQVVVDVASLPDECPLRHMLSGHSGLAASSALDVHASVLRLIVLWLANAETASHAASALDDEQMTAAIEWSDFLCVPSLRQCLQRRVLTTRLKAAEEERRTGQRGEFDAIVALQAFKASGREHQVLHGLSPMEISATSDAAKLLGLQTMRLGSELPRALVIARQGVRVDLKALGLQHAPRTSRAAKHGSGGRQRRSGGRGDKKR